MNLPEYAYFKGEIVPYSEAKVGVLTHALNYGTGVFGGVRARIRMMIKGSYIFSALMIITSVF